MFIIRSSYSYSACGKREHPANFQNKSVNCPFIQVSRYIRFLPKLKGKERPFWKCAIMKRRRTTLQDYTLVDIRHEKLSLFRKFEIILPLPCFLLGPPHKSALRDMDFYDKLVDRFQDQSKVNNSVNKAKV